MALKEINGGYFFRKRTPGPLLKLIKKRVYFKRLKPSPQIYPQVFPMEIFFVLDFAEFTMVSRSLWSERSILIDKYMPLDP